MKSLVTDFKNWCQTEIPARPLRALRNAFAAIWLVYDLIDLTTGQTAKNAFILGMNLDPNWLKSSQVITILCEVGILLGWQSRWFLLGACVSRAWLGTIYSLNDFLYFTVVALLLAQADCDAGVEMTPRWPRDLLLLQTTWMYFCSSLLKMNPDFLSGGDLYARGNYVARALPFFYPKFYVSWLGHMSFDSALAWTAVAIELLLAILLLLLTCRFHNRGLRNLILVLTLAVHIFAAYAYNVFFFGASLIAQVYFLTLSRAEE